MKGGLGVQSLLGLVLTPRTGTLTSNSDIQLTDFLSHPSIYIIIWHSPASCGITIRTQFNPSTVKVIPRYLRPDAPIIYTDAFLIWQFGRVGGQYVTVVAIYIRPGHALRTAWSSDPFVLIAFSANWNAFPVWGDSRKEETRRKYKRLNVSERRSSCDIFHEIPWLKRLLNLSSCQSISGLHSLVLPPLLLYL